MASMTGFNAHIARKVFPPVAGAPERLVFEDFQLEVMPGAFVCVLGPSGVGKTTLLNMVAGLDRTFAGAVDFTGAASGRSPRISYAFQTPRLLPWRTVLENVLLPLPPDAAARERARGLLAEMGLSESEGVYPERLSVGMQRRVALARAFAIEPDIMLMDEPFVSLDEANADRLRDLLAGLIERRPCTVVFVTHDSREAVRLADRIVVLGGPPAHILRDVKIDMAPAVRRDETAVEAVRARLLGGADGGERPSARRASGA